VRGPEGFSSCGEVSPTARGAFVTFAGRRRFAIFGTMLLGAVLAAGAGATVAVAHAFLDRAEPRVGSTVKTAPSEVRLHFTERLEPAYSTAQVVTESGQRVDRGDPRVDEADPTLLRISIAAPAPGKYKVIWRVLSVDTHVTEGDFTFRVAP
jgi:copper resistance protein C